MCCVELLLKIYTKRNGCIISDSTAEEGTATWTEHRAEGDRGVQQAETCSCTRELQKPEGGRTSWKRDLDKGREKVEKSASEEQTGREVSRKDL